MLANQWEKHFDTPLSVASFLQSVAEWQIPRNGQQVSVDQNLVEAWNSLQSVSSYVERHARGDMVEGEVQQ